VHDLAGGKVGGFEDCVETVPGEPPELGGELIVGGYTHLKRLGVRAERPTQAAG
jgi:hypothetical protein